MKTIIIDTDKFPVGTSNISFDIIAQNELGQYHQDGAIEVKRNHPNATKFIFKSKLNRKQQTLYYIERL